MRDRARQVATLSVRVLASSALLCVGGGAALAQVEGAPRIVDGQTLEVAGRHFRLHGVVAPALDQVCHRAGKPYPCGSVARAVLWDLAAGRDVICTPAPGAGTSDDAAPGTCTAGGTNLNQAMVESGWALADRATADAYGALEDAARAAGRGLWRSQFELPGAPRPTPE